MLRGCLWFQEGGVAAGAGGRARCVHKQATVACGYSIKLWIEVKPQPSLTSDFGRCFERLFVRTGLSKSGIEYAGLSWDGSLDGAPKGGREDEALPCKAAAGGGLEFAVVVRPLSAVIVRVG